MSMCCKFFLIFVFSSLTGCLFESGVIDPGEDNLDPLFSFQGTTNVEDSLISASKLQKLTAPKIAVVWQFVGISPQINNSSTATVDITPPYNFQGDIFNPPPNELSLGKEPAIGGFWLYSDENGNNEFDESFHPDHLKLIHQLEKEKNAYNTLLEEFIESSQLVERTDFSETFYIGDKGVIYADFKRETVEYFDPTDYALDSNFWETLIYRRMAILSHLNKWEQFFLRRARDIYPLQTKVTSSEEFAYEVKLEYKRRIFPVPGKEAEFEKALLEVVLAFLKVRSHALEIYRTAQKEGWLDHPYSTGNDKDWVAGRSIWYHLLYFPSYENIQELRNAEIESAFNISNLSKLKTGYNLIHCTDQYVCEVMDMDATIEIFLGSKLEHFDAPSATQIKPRKHPESVGLDSTEVSDYQGTYELAPFMYVYLYKVNEKLWLQFPGRPLYSLHSSGDYFFFSDIFGTQISFIPDSTGKIVKFLIHDEDFKTSAVKMKNTVPDSVSKKVKDVNNRKLALSHFAGTELQEGAYFHNSDTLYVKEGSRGELVLEVPSVLNFETAYKISLYEWEGSYTFGESEVVFDVSKNDSGGVVGITYQYGLSKIKFEPVVE